MFKLQSAPTRTGGSVSFWGEYSSLRDCTVAARQIFALAKREMYFSARDESNTNAFAVTHTIALAPGEYQQDTELVLSDGRIVWLGDVDVVLRDHLGPLPKQLSSTWERESY